MLIALLVVGTVHYLTGFAEIRFVRGRYEPNLLWSAWNSFSRVAVYPSEGQAKDQAWGLSRTYRGAIPDQLGMVVDDTGYTTMYRWDPSTDMDFFRRNGSWALALRTVPNSSGSAIGPLSPKSADSSARK